MKIVDMVESQIIATVKRPSDIEMAITSNANMVFLLTGDLLTMEGYIRQLKDVGKSVFLHLDFIEGLSAQKSAIEFIAEKWRPDGIITTKVHMIKLAKQNNLLTIQRLFLLDQNAFDNGVKMVKKCQPDAVEVLPALMPKVIDQLTMKIKQPLIVGGLISSKKEIIEAIEAGALAASASSPHLWSLDI